MASYCIRGIQEVFRLCATPQAQLDSTPVSCHGGEMNLNLRDEMCEYKTYTSFSFHILLRLIHDIVKSHLQASGRQTEIIKPSKKRRLQKNYDRSKDVSPTCLICSDGETYLENLISVDGS